VAPHNTLADGEPDAMPVIHSRAMKAPKNVEDIVRGCFNANAVVSH
jgi:hypothetical protein